MSHITRTRWTSRVMAVLAGLAAVSLVPSITTTARADDADGPACPDERDTLVLGAMPLEVAPLIEQADITEIISVNGRDFRRGTLAGTPVVIAMTRIGLVNARLTTELAFDTFECGFHAVVFTGVAGSTARIGDVAIADSWTIDGGATFTDVDAEMLAVARDHADEWEAGLSAEVPVGDDACLCPGVETLSTPISVGGPRAIIVGGTGTSGDTYGGKALPCVPGGGDVFGCKPCLTSTSPPDVAEFATSVPSYLDPGFFSAFFTPPAETTDEHVSQDQESAAVLAVADERGVPFLAIRAASDGTGDPLNLPGFPFQFFAYRHLAGNNAASVTVDFLAAWSAAGRPTVSTTTATPA